MCKVRSLIYRLVISKSVKVVSSLKKGWQYGAVRKYGTPQFLQKSTVRWYGTLVRYAFFVIVRVR